jgi:hypothetical protein
MYKITLGLKWGDNRFIVWQGIRAVKAFDTRQEAEDYIDDCLSWTDPENIYNLPGIRQSIEEDRK